MNKGWQFYSGQAPLEKAQETSARLSALDAASERIEGKMRELLIYKSVWQLSEEEATNEKIREVVQRELDRLFKLAGLNPEDKMSNPLIMKFDWGELILDKSHINDILIALDYQGTRRLLYIIYHYLEEYTIYSYWDIPSIEGSLEETIKDMSWWINRKEWMNTVNFDTWWSERGYWYEKKSSDLVEEWITTLSLLADMQKLIDDVEWVIRNNKSLVKNSR